MYYTFSQAKQLLGRFADGGCEQAGATINAAVERLMASSNWKDTRAIMKMCVVDTVFPLPQNVETIERVCVNGTPTEIFGTEYQFVPGGPGDLDYRQNEGYGYGDLVDAGEHATMFDVPLDPIGYKLVAFSRYPEDSKKQIRLYGFNERNEEIQVLLPITRWGGGVEGVVDGAWGVPKVPVTEDTFTSVSRMLLPESLRGYVSLYAVLPESNVMRFLAKYNPAMLVPTFRRYRFVRALSDTGYAIVVAEVRVRFVPLSDDYDLVPVEGLQAVQNMMQAIKAEAAGELQVANAFEVNALRILAEKQKAKKGPTCPVIRSPTRLSSCAAQSGFYGL